MPAITALDKSNSIFFPVTDVVMNKINAATHVLQSARSRTHTSSTRLSLAWPTHSPVGNYFCTTKSQDMKQTENVVVSNFKIMRMDDNGLIIEMKRGFKTKQEAEQFLNDFTNRSKSLYGEGHKQSYWIESN